MHTTAIHYTTYSIKAKHSPLKKISVFQLPVLPDVDISSCWQNLFYLFYLH